MDSDYKQSGSKVNKRVKQADEVGDANENARKRLKNNRRSSTRRAPKQTQKTESVDATGVNESVHAPREDQEAKTVEALEAQNTVNVPVEEHITEPQEDAGASMVEANVDATMVEASKTVQKLQTSKNETPVLGKRKTDRKRKATPKCEVSLN